MPLFHAMPRTVPIVLAQQGGAAPGNNNSAYEGGRMVGQIMGYVMVGAIILWAVGKLFKGR